MKKMKKIKKVLLFIPPAFTFKDNIDINPLPPLGLAYLGAVLEGNGIQTKIVDCLVEGWEKRAEIGKDTIRIGLPFEEIEEIIRQYDPDLVGVNVLFTKQRENAHKIFSLAKKVNKNIVTVAGGAHATVLPEMVLADQNVDYAVIGEGENTLIDLINVLEGKSDRSVLDGIGFKDQNTIRILPKTKFISDLDGLPFPARHLLNMEKYFGLAASHGTRRKERFSPIITSRGCPAKCTFCSAKQVWGKKYRCRSAENVIAEMKQIKSTYAIEELLFEDDNFNLNVGRTEKILDLMIQEKLNFVWDTPNGVSAYSLNENIIYKMKRSGCYKLNLPIETGNQYVMDNIIKKPVKLHRIKPLVDYARSIQLDVGMFLVMGMPGEKEEQIWDSFRLARDLKIYSPHISIATPYPGSELYDICVQKKYLPDNFSLDDLYIRSFCIATEDWDGKKLKEIYNKGKRYLIISFFKDQPFKFILKGIQKLINICVSYPKSIFRNA
ncbi:MAG TPA: hypothetical protein DCK76_01910 [Desulfotomaculum sp.]|nr:MAG: Radical SAM protein with Cobalamin (Vitamin B12)-binding domain [Desulfotomaculum sp. 46_296]HAG10156.1 hypothetical protein [Desulfotomaculum sp.]HBY03653.1 hypothetical protein [Desulfotomaculum sp.]